MQIIADRNEDILKKQKQSNKVRRIIEISSNYIGLSI